MWIGLFDVFRFLAFSTFPTLHDGRRRPQDRPETAEEAQKRAPRRAPLYCAVLSGTPDAGRQPLTIQRMRQGGDTRH
eukprot:747976-Pyramimonas_sp.AAC.1